MAKKKHLVMARTPEAMKKGVQTSKGTLSFQGKSGMIVNDDVVDEIEKTQGLKGTGDVWTMEDQRYTHDSHYKADGVHSYIFGATSRYAAAWEAFERRRQKRIHAGEKSPEVENV